MPSSTLRWIIAAAFVPALSACASFIGHGLVPGVSTAQEVLADLGQPAYRVEQPDRSATWFYSRQPAGRQNFALQMSPEGVMRSMEQVLTYANLAKVVVGQTTTEQVRAILGPPARIDRMERQQQDAWLYWMVLDAVPVHVWVMSSNDGVVRDIVKTEDLPLTPGRRRR